LAFQPDTDITKPVEPYWHYAQQVMDEAENHSKFVILSMDGFGG
jgi:hypothetical protein